MIVALTRLSSEVKRLLRTQYCSGKVPAAIL